MFHMNHEATVSTKMVVDYLFTALIPSLTGTLTSENIEASYSMFDGYVAGKMDSFFRALEAQRQQDNIIREKEDEIERLKESSIEKEDEIERLKESSIEKEDEIERLKESLKVLSVENEILRAEIPAAARNLRRSKK
jgi:chromosome segregation ATPase